MKTITTFIISLTLFILSIAVMFYSINTLKYISTTFYNKSLDETYTFSFTFVLAYVISFIFAIILLIASIKYFVLHRKYYHSYMLNKRDREVKDKVENAKYNQLYEDLRDCETVELKEAVLKTFYSTKNIAKQADLNRILNNTSKPSRVDWADMGDMGDIPINTNQEDFDAMISSGLKDKPTTPPVKKIPTPHDLMGFEDIIFDRVDKK